MNTLPLQHHHDVHAQLLNYQGYTTIPDAIPADLLEAINRRFDELLETIVDTGGAHHHQSVGSLYLKRLFEKDPVFCELMDLPAVFPIVEKAVGVELRLAQGGLGHVLAAHSPAHVGWHRDGDEPVIRCTYYLRDTTTQMGPFTLVPATHHAPEGPPRWYNDAPAGEELAQGINAAPREIPGMVRIAGKAGSCLLNNTRIWHTNTPNVADQPRYVIWVLYRAATTEFKRDWGGEYDFDETFALSQSNPIRHRLCGGVNMNASGEKP